jgi:hypothetical protein
MYVDTSYDPDPATGHDGTIAPQSAREVLAGVLANEGADLSAHETLERAHRQAEDFTVLAAEYETLARVAQQQRWDALLDRSGLGPDGLVQIRRSEVYGPLLAALRAAESRGLDVEKTFPKLVAARPLSDAEDPASVMHGRVERWAQAAGSKRQGGTNLIAGLVPRATGVSDPDMARALVERDKAMERRARELAEQAIAQDEGWVRRLGPPPGDPAGRERWIEAVSTVAAYRHRWNIGNDHRSLGSGRAVTTIEGMEQRQHAQAATSMASRTTGKPSVKPSDTGVFAAGVSTAGGVEL